jgi:hypothetical protein
MSVFIGRSTLKASSDGTFADADWQIHLFTYGGGGSITGTSYRQADIQHPRER